MGGVTARARGLVAGSARGAVFGSGGRGRPGVSPAPVAGSPAGRTTGRLARGTGGGGVCRTGGALAPGSCNAASSASGNASVGSPSAAEPGHGSIGADVSSGTSWSSTSCTARGGSIAETPSRALVHGSPTTAPLHAHPRRGARSITRRSFSEIRNATSARKSRAVGSISVYPRFSAYNQLGAGAPPGSE